MTIYTYMHNINLNISLVYEKKKYTKFFFHNICGGGG
jgi:hypothetical protein